MTALRAIRKTQLGKRRASSSESMFWWMRSRISATTSSARFGSAIRRRTKVCSRPSRSRQTCSVGSPTLRRASLLVILVVMASPAWHPASARL
jgi:hypothetical protein